MRKVIVTVSAFVLLVATAGAALAARPDRYTEQFSGSEYDAATSELCGFDVWVTYRARYMLSAHSDGSAVETFDSQRFRTGPGGSIIQLVHYVWTYPDPFLIIGDPESGSWQEVFHPILHGSRVWTTAGAGVIARDAGYYDATIVTTVTPDDVTVEVTDEIARGQQPSMLTEDALNQLLCATLG